MFYNSKKLIDEKVLQQYYFEEFMLADSTLRRQLLPERFAKYAPTDVVKGLNPEVRVGEKSTSGSHVTDYVLYPMPGSGLEKLNIELKWRVKDFENQPERFRHYNGDVSEGFVVAIRDDAYAPPTVDGGRISTVYLDARRFTSWFTRKSHSIVSQALANKLGFPPARLTGARYWVVCIVRASESHYLKHGRPNNIWAFRDNNSPRNIMNVLDGDYVAFVRLGSCDPGRAVYPWATKAGTVFKKSRGGHLRNTDISWTLDLVDIRRVERGYHLNYSDRSPYGGFDEDWMSTVERLPEHKNYTQFITFAKPDEDYNTHMWEHRAGTLLDRRDFPDDSPGALGFVNALRASMNTRGDAVPMSRESFETVLRLVSELG